MHQRIEWFSIERNKFFACYLSGFGVREEPFLLSFLLVCVAYQAMLIILLLPRCLCGFFSHNI